VGSILILLGFAGLVAGLSGLAKGNLRLLRIGSRKQAAVATGIAFVVWLAGGALAAPSQTPAPAKATSPASAATSSPVLTATPAPIPTNTPGAAPASAPAVSQGPATVSSSGEPSCGRDSYVNVDGNCVQRPVSSSSAPAGATAQCTDGTYSFSQHRSGTCSHHGGVAAWL
jgi:predicted lipid-binding transport protein (Tim44 family)